MRPSHLLLRACAPIALTLAGLASLQPLAAAPGDAQVTPGEFVIEHPTLINLGFEWHIDGDGNRNASVEVSFRKQGETAWRRGMPLARLHGEQVFQRNVFNLVVPNMFAGSILDLEPDTAYEARFVMTDSGGIQEETTVLGVPCLTLRDNTERPATIRQGTNRLAGTHPAGILKHVARLLKGDLPPRRVPPLWAGGGLLHTTPHCVVVTASGAELASCTSHTEQAVGSSPVRSCGVTESRTVFRGGGGSGRSIPAVGNGRSRELCEALELAPMTLQVASLPPLDQQPQQANRCDD